jgi:hypothetical protein
MADVVIPKSIPCKFDEKGWAPCKIPSTNGLCSKHEKAKCVSCGGQALRSCDEGMGGLACGADLCLTCQHSMEGGTHVTKQVYKAQMREEAELSQTGKESERMLALRGVPTDVELPRHLEELLRAKSEDFNLAVCYILRIKHGLMGEFPAILKDSRIAVITPDKDAIVRIWSSLSPRDSEIISDFWMIYPKIGVGYRMCHDRSEQKQSKPYKIFSKEEIDLLFANTKKPFAWAPGLIGGSISQQHFDTIIQREVAA